MRAGALTDDRAPVARRAQHPDPSMNCFMRTHVAYGAITAARSLVTLHGSCMIAWHHVELQHSRCSKRNAHHFECVWGITAVETKIRKRQYLRSPDGSVTFQK